MVAYAFTVSLERVVSIPFASAVRPNWYWRKSNYFTPFFCHCINKSKIHTPIFLHLAHSFILLKIRAAKVKLACKITECNFWFHHWYWQIANPWLLAPRSIRCCTLSVKPWEFLPFSCWRGTSFPSLWLWHHDPKPDSEVMQQRQVG